MAILFNTTIPDDRLLLAHVNNVIRFYSNSVKVVTNANVTFNGNNLVLYPSPAGIFYFNFKDYIIAEIQRSGNDDVLNSNISTTGFLYDITNKNYLESTVVIKINFTDLTFETITKSYKWLNALVQVQDWKRKFPVSANILTPFLLYYFKNNLVIKYWEGYPFDISIYTGTAVNLKLDNLTNLLSHTFLSPTKVNRLILSDGRTDVTLESLVPILLGNNKMKITSNSLLNYFELEKIDVQCSGHYFKFLNSFGGWSYWWFSKGNIKRTTKDLGEIFNDFENFENTISVTKQIGKDSKDVLSIQSDVLTPTDLDILIDIVDSKKVYLFTGLPFAKNTFNDWLEVSLNAGSFPIQNAKNENTILSFQIEMPERNTMKL